MAESEHFRVFVAIATPEEIRARILPAQAELEKAASKARVRWTRPEQFHLTLRFLGDVLSGRVAALTGALRRACSGFEPLRLHATGIGFFPDSRFPRVVWVGLRDSNDNLSKVQKAVETACHEFTAESAEKRFSGHITLGRIKAINRQEAHRLAKAASALAGQVLGEWTAESIDLVRSELDQAGARHRTLAVIPLAGR